MKYFISVSLTAVSLAVQAQLFIQDFESSTVLSDYYSTVPGINQFNSIKANGTTIAEIADGSLRLTRADSSSCGFYRNTDFIPVPKIIQYTFDIEVSGNSAGQTTAATFYAGSGLASGVSLESDKKKIHSRFGINLGSNPGEFSVRQISGSSGKTYSGRQTLTWVVNNSDVPFSYTGPDGSTEIAAPDTWDLWIGTFKELNDKSAETGDQELKNFKFVFTAGSAAIDIDNIIITDFTVLPVNLTTFTAAIKNSNVQLRWTTASEKNNSHFNIHRSQDGKEFEKIAVIAAGGNSAELLHYNYRDNALLPGINYYRLEQEDFDGKKTVLGVTSVKNEVPLQMKFLSINQQEAQFSIYSAKAQTGVFTLKNSIGQALIHLNLKMEAGYNQAVVFLNGRCRGLHIASVRTKDEIVSQKLLW